MELVRQFTSELNSIYDGKLPVSRAKMASITRSAVKSLKYYKHIVMSIEKFISKCGPVYKLPGLYVIDSIVRQSRHQFGTEKDVYGPRFSKNIEKTFRNLYMCTPSDQPKIMRVLNLWQKNEVFPTEVIQKLMVLAPNPDATPSSTAPAPSVGGGSDDGGVGGELDLSSASVIIQQQQNQIQALLQQQQQLQSQTSTLLAPALQGLLSQQNSGTGSGVGQVEMLTTLLQQAQQLQAVQNQLATVPPTAHTAPEPESQPVFNTALLDDDFDYSSEEEGGGSARVVSRQRDRRQDFTTTINDVAREVSPDHPEHLGTVSNDQEAIIRQLEQQILLHQRKQKLQEQEVPAVKHGGLKYEQEAKSPPPPVRHGLPAPIDQPRIQEFHPRNPPSHVVHETPSRGDHPPEILARGEPPPQRKDYPPHQLPPRDWEHRYLPPVHSGTHSFPPPPPPDMPLPPHPSHPAHPPHPSHPAHPPHPSHPAHPPHPSHPPHPPHPAAVERPPPGPHPPFYSHHGRRSPSPPPPLRRDRFHSPPPSSHSGRGRSPSPPNRRSSGYWRDRERERDRDRDGERDRDRESRRSRQSRSPRRHRTRSRSRSRSPMPRHPSPPISAEERERRKKGIPFPKVKHVSVCSCTIWVGHLSKTAKEPQIKTAFEDYGQVKSVDVVAARGCAYVVMVHRNDATRALNGLKDTRLCGSACKLAWAPGRGVKGSSHRSYWNLDEGVSFIPWDKVKTQQELIELADGGWIDPTTCPEGMSPPVLQQDAEASEVPSLPPGPPPVSMPPIPGPLAGPMPPPMRTAMPHPSNPIGHPPPGHMGPIPPGHMSAMPRPGMVPPGSGPRGPIGPPPPMPQSAPRNYLGPQGPMMPPHHDFMPPGPHHMTPPPRHGPHPRFNRPPMDYLPPQPGQMNMPPRSGQMNMPPRSAQMNMPPRSGQMMHPGRMPYPAPGGPHPPQSGFIPPMGPGGHGGHPQPHDRFIPPTSQMSPGFNQVSGAGYPGPGPSRSGPQPVPEHVPSLADKTSHYEPDMLLETVDNFNPPSSEVSTSELQSEETHSNAVPSSSHNPEMLPQKFEAVAENVPDQVADESHSIMKDDDNMSIDEDDDTGEESAVVPGPASFQEPVTLQNEAGSSEDHSESQYLDSLPSATHPDHPDHPDNKSDTIDSSASINPVSSTTTNTTSNPSGDPYSEWANANYMWAPTEQPHPSPPPPEQPDSMETDANPIVSTDASPDWPRPISPINNMGLSEQSVPSDEWHLPPHLIQGDSPPEQSDMTPPEQSVPSDQWHDSSPPPQSIQIESSPEQSDMTQSVPRHDSSPLESIQNDLPSEENDANPLAQAVPCDWSDSDSSPPPQPIPCNLPSDVEQAVPTCDIPTDRDWHGSSPLIPREQPDLSPPVQVTPCDIYPEQSDSSLPIQVIPSGLPNSGPPVQDIQSNLPSDQPDSTPPPELPPEQIDSNLQPQLILPGHCDDASPPIQTIPNEVPLEQADITLDVSDDPEQFGSGESNGDFSHTLTSIDECTSAGDEELASAIPEA